MRGCVAGQAESWCEWRVRSKGLVTHAINRSYLKKLSFASCEWSVMLVRKSTIAVVLLLEEDN